MDFWSVLATILFVLLVLSWILRLALRFLPQKPPGADKVQQELESVFGGRHIFRRASPAEFRHIPARFYDETQRWLESQGFRTLGDIEDVTLSQTYPKLRTFLRAFVSGDGTIMAACYDVRPQGWFKILQMAKLLPNDFRTLDLETEFHDGTFLCVSNSEGRDQLNEAPGERKIQLPPETPHDEMLRLHRAVVEQWQRDDHELKPVIVQTLDDVIEAQHRMQDLKSRHRQQTGYISDEEMRRIAGPTMQDTGADLLRKLRDIQAGQKGVPRP